MQHFSEFCDCIFTFLLYSFFKHVFHFDEIQFASFACDAGVISEKPFPNPGFRRDTPVFSALLYLALRFIFNYSICVSSWVHIHPFAHAYLISIPIVWTHLLKLDLNARAAGLWPQWLLCLLMPASQHLDCFTFAVFGGRKWAFFQSSSSKSLLLLLDIWHIFLRNIVSSCYKFFHLVLISLKVNISHFSRITHIYIFIHIMYIVDHHVFVRGHIERNIAKSYLPYKYFKE